MNPWQQLLELSPDTTLYLAARNNYRPMILEALRRGANPSIGLTGAINGNHEGLVAELLDPEETELEKAIPKKEDPLSGIPDTEENRRRIKVFKEEFEKHFEHEARSLEVFERAIQCNQEAMIESLLKSINLKLGVGLTLKYRRSDIFRKILLRGLERGLELPLDQLLLVAATLGLWDDFRFLIEKGANPDLGIALAADARELDLVRWILRENADPNLALPSLIRDHEWNFLKSLDWGLVAPGPLKSANSIIALSLLLDGSVMTPGASAVARAVMDNELTSGAIVGENKEENFPEIIKWLFTRTKEFPKALELLAQSQHQLLLVELLTIPRLKTEDLLAAAIKDGEEQTLRKILGQVSNPDELVANCLRIHPELITPLCCKLPEYQVKLLRGLDGNQLGETPQEDSQCVRLIAKLTLKLLQDHLKGVAILFPDDEGVKETQEKFTEFERKLDAHPREVLIDLRDFMRERMGSD